MLTQQQDLNDQIDAESNCESSLEMIGPIPFVTPPGFSAPWFIDLALKDIRARVDRQSQAERPDYRALSQEIGAIERQIGTTADHVIQATRGMQFEAVSGRRSSSAKRREKLNKTRQLSSTNLNPLQAKRLDKINRKIAAAISAKDESNLQKAFAEARSFQESLSENANSSWAADAVQETLTLAHRRGEAVRSRIGGGAVRRTQLNILLSNEELTPEQYEAGKRYGHLIEKLLSPRIKSCLDDSGGGFGVRAAESRAAAVEERAQVWQWLRHDARMITLLDRVCVNDESLHAIARGDTKQRARLAERLVDTLEILAAKYERPRSAAA